MNEKIRKVLSWLGGISAFVLAVLCGRWKRNADRKRISDAKDSVADGRRTTDEIRERNSVAQGEAQGIAGTGDELADKIRESSLNVERAGEGLGNAHDAVRHGIEILDEVEKRNNNK